MRFVGIFISIPLIVRFLGTAAGEATNRGRFYSHKHNKK